MGKIGMWEIMAIIAVLTMIFGVKKLPDLGKSFGETINNFKQAVKDEGEDADVDVEG